MKEVLEGLWAGISFEELHYYWPYKKIRLTEGEEYLNFTYNVNRIKKDNWKGNDIRGSSGPDYCGYPHITLEFMYKARKWIKTHDYEESIVGNVIAHELHHLAQNIRNINNLETIESIPRHMRENPYVKYFLNPYEIEAYQVGFRAESDISGRTVGQCIDRFLENYRKLELINRKEYNAICVNWINNEVKLVEVQK
jgi:hypothetical protein